MPLHDIACSDDSCATRFEAYVSLADYPASPACPKCGGATYRAMSRRAPDRGTVDPVVAYQAPDGTFRFPPDISTSSTAMYDKLGYTRIELRGWTDVRRFEKHMNQAELSNVRRRVEKQQEQHERAESERRSEIRRGLDQGFQVPEQDDRGRLTGRMKTVRLSPRGRAIMQAAIANNDRKGGPRAHDPGFRVEAYSNDRNNRDPDPRRRNQ
jgi:Zinc ribbon domain.